MAIVNCLYDQSGIVFYFASLTILILTMKPFNKPLVLTFLLSVFQWYDFYIFIAVFPIISNWFFSIKSPTISILCVLLLYGSLFLPRLLGVFFGAGLVKIKHKQTVYLYSCLLMTIASVLFVILPTQYSIGLYAPFLLLFCRLLQGIAVGSSFGGDLAFLIADATPTDTTKKIAWLQAAPFVGLFLSILALLYVQSNSSFGILQHPLTGMTINNFKTEYGGWRLLFAFSAIGFILCVFFTGTKMYEYQTALLPTKETPSWVSKNTQQVIVAVFTVGLAYGVLFYTMQFFAKMFLEKACNLKLQNANEIMLWTLLLSLPFFAIAYWIVNKVKALQLLVLVGIASFLLSIVFSFIALQDRSAIKYKTELIDLKEVQIKYIRKANSGDTLKKITSYHTYDDATKSVMSRVDTIFALHYKPSAQDKRVSIETDISSATFIVLILLLLVPFFFFALTSVAITKYLASSFPTDIQYRAFTLFNTLSTCFVPLIVGIVVYTENQKTFLSFEEEATLILKTLIVIGGVATISTMFYFFFKKKPLAQ